MYIYEFISAFSSENNLGNVFRACRKGPERPEKTRFLENGHIGLLIAYFHLKVEITTNTELLFNSTNEELYANVDGKPTPDRFTILDSPDTHY